MANETISQWRTQNAITPVDATLFPCEEGGNAGASTLAEIRTALGLSAPATNQVALTANGESVIADNDSATPSFRPDANDTWCLGESSYQWKCIQGGAGTVANPSLEIAGSVGIYQPAAGQIALTVDKTSPTLVVDGVLDAATGNEVAYDQAVTVNKATSGDYTAWQLNVTETAAPGTANKLSSWQVGGVEQAYLTSGGNLVSTNAGTTAAPSIAVRDESHGIYSPATNQVGLVANNEAIIVDNDSATPSLRPDVTSTWDLGEAAVTWKIGYFEGLNVGTSGIGVSGDVSVSNNGDISLTGSLEWLYSADVVATTSDTIDPVNEKGTRLRYTNSSDVTITMNQASSGVQNGAKIEFMQGGTGQLVFSAGTATVRVPDGYQARSLGQYAVVQATYESNSEVWLEGDLAPAGEGSAITGTTHSTDVNADVVPRDCSNASGCTVTVNSAYAGCLLGPYFASTASQAVTFSNGTATLAHLDATLTAVTRGQNAKAWILYLSASTYTLLGELAAA